MFAGMGKVSDVIHICLLAAVLLVSTTVRAEEVHVGLGYATPPYVIASDESGLEVEIIREAFALAGHEALFEFLPNDRLPMHFNDKSVDCVAAPIESDMYGISGHKRFLSRQTIVFQNHAISIRRDGFVIDSVIDLSNKRLLAFQGARNFLGPAFAEMVQRNPDYSELADQSLQVRMLYSRRVQVLISDKRIFNWWRNRLREESFEQPLDLKQAVVFHPIFPPTPRGLLFSDRTLRDDFNRGLEQLEASGRLDVINLKYEEGTPVE